MMWWNHGAWGAGDWTLMAAMMLVFWGLLVAFVVWLVRSTRSDRGAEDRSAGSPVPRADEVLAEGFARGEIDEDEYRRRLALLQSTAGRS